MMNQRRWKRWRTYLGPVMAVMILSGNFLLPHGGLAKWWRAARPVQLPELKFRMIDVTDSSGFKTEYNGFKVSPVLQNVAPWFEAVSGGVAVVDFDSDGWQDLVLHGTDIGSRNYFYRNNQDGTFKDVTDEAGITAAAILGATRMIFFDADNDGHKDLFVMTFCPRIFRNRGNGTFQEKTSESSFGCKLFYGGANVIDYDGDGFLDVVVAPFTDSDLKWAPKDTRVMPDNFHDAYNGKKPHVFRNDGKGHFTPVPGNLGMEHNGWTHAIGAYDIRGSGRPDLWFSTDFSRDKLYFNHGNGKFEPSFESILPSGLSTNGMSIDFADLDDDGHPVAYSSQLYVPGQEVTGNLLWKWVKDRKFDQIADGRGVHDCGWSWGAKFIDFDNDGKLDLFVGNGYVSGNPNKSYWFSMATLDASDRSVLQDAKNWPPMGDASFGGHQRACVFLNQGKRFINVAKLTPLVTNTKDERGVGLIDFLNNGSQGLVVSYQKGPARLFEIQQLNSNQWIGFKLVGTKSNRDAIGSKVTLVLADRTMTRQLQPLNGYASQSDDRVHFGLGKGASIQKAWINWPSGIRQELDPAALKLNQYHQITER